MTPILKKKSIRINIGRNYSKMLAVIMFECGLWVTFIFSFMLFYSFQCFYS